MRTKKHVHIYPIYTDKRIKPDRNLIEFISKILFGKEDILICHLGVPLGNESISIGKIGIQNKIEIDTRLIYMLNKFINLTVIYDSTTPERKILQYISLQLLVILFGSINHKLKYLFNELLKSELLEIGYTSTTALRENNHLEFKNRDWLPTKDKDIVEKISNLIKSKYKEKFLAIIIGFHEKDQLIEGIPLSQFGDDRVNNLEEKIKGKISYEFRIDKLQVNKNQFLLVLFVYEPIIN
ncbi:MAG: hypothetical protein HeimC3_43660 [Candidatus Heimdallarchaeota archaeon LC_3]|nr:MAG: hypothetical protein HeimC3_43660 [Candidatus Heimdallarchaeota archaeon LC_3]